jgi:type I restriction enzyme S subunit
MNKVLGDIAKLQGGYAYKSRDLGEVGLPVVKIGDVTGGGSISYGNMQKIPLPIATETERFATNAGDTLISMTGANVGKVARVGDNDPAARINQRVGRFVPIPAAGYCKDYIHYIVSSKPAYQFFANAAYGSAQPNISGALIESLPVPEIEADVANKIGKVLASLDDKIELNRRMNETLEEMARALFRDWFVDFGPTRRQMEGATDPAAIMGQAFPPEKATTLASLFPAKLGDDGLPEGWEKKVIGAFVDVLETGRRPKGGVKGIDTGVPSVGAESIKRVGVFDMGKTKYVPREFFDAMNSGHIKDGGKPGELRPAVSYVSSGFPFEEFCINEHVFRLRLNNIPQVTGYCALTTDDAFWQMRELATGVAQPGLNQKAMKSVSIVCPDDLELFSKFAEIASPLIDGCNQNAKQNQTLAEMRDLLLPKLMSGEIRLKDVEAQL